LGRLGDHFPEPEKQKYIERNLKPGQVLYLFCTFTSPPKEKYLVFVCADPVPLFFIINSRIHPYVAGQPALNQCQVKLRSVDYRFLDHDSYVDCSNVVTAFNEDDLERQVIRDVGRIKGELTITSKEEIIQAVQNARTISKRHKGLIIDALK